MCATTSKGGRLRLRGHFGGTGGVVFYAARPSVEFLDYHRAALANAGPGSLDSLWEHYRPGRLTPHCTMAQELEREQMGPAILLCQERLPLSGQLAGVNLVSLVTGEAARLITF